MMENKSQKSAFTEYEADAWFDRNKPSIEKYDPKKDKVIDLIKEYNLETDAVLEIGCSGAYRLNGILSELGHGKMFGLEPSGKAVAYGKQNFPGIEIIQGTADNLEAFKSNSMDLIIVGFVFYVIDRDIVFKVISEIDRVLKNGGTLLIVDFFAETPLKNEYEHIKNFKAYSFKQNYEEIFTSSKLYYLLSKTTLHHVTFAPDASDDYYNKISLSLLKKDVISSYR
jgi:ubiquinone/menaquinone biosynthesis C-methylase UbiE